MRNIIKNTDYSIYIDKNLDYLSEFITNSEYNFEKFFILVDENTHAKCINVLLSKVKILQQAEIIEMDAGEQHKNLNTATYLWQALLENEANKNTLLINLGGGVVTDMGGFVASVFKRGIPFIHIPTTLLAMTDAAVGGKTGVDLDNYKNQIGTITNPLGVFISIDFIKTMEDRDLFSAFGELLKTALISSEDMWEKLQNENIDRNADFETLINESVEIKNKIVQNDLNEKGERKTLNFGHTFGHALESLSLVKKKRKLFHGEAVAMGIIIELYISTKMCGFPEDIQKSIEKYILNNFDIYTIEENDFDEILDFIKKDKKNSQSDILFVLLENIGKPLINQKVHEDLIIAALHYYSNL